MRESERWNELERGGGRNEEGRYLERGRERGRGGQMGEK